MLTGFKSLVLLSGQKQNPPKGGIRFWLRRRDVDRVQIPQALIRTKTKPAKGRDSFLVAEEGFEPTTFGL